MTSSPMALDAGEMAQRVTELLLEAIPVLGQLAITIHESDSDIS